MLVGDGPCEIPRCISRYFPVAFVAASFGGEGGGGGGG